MKSIFLIQSYSKTIPAKLIKLYTRYEYSHISLALDEKLSKMYSFGRKTVNNPFNGGFITESLDGPFYTKFSNTDCRIYKITITDKQYYQLTKILKKYEKNPEKYKYDIIGIILKFFKININRKHHYVCTQFVGQIISDANIYNFNIPFAKLKPKDFEQIPFNDQIYVGKIKEYQ